MQEPSPNTTHPTRRWSQSQSESMRTVFWHLTLLRWWRIKRRSRRCLTESRIIRFKLTWIATYCLASGSMMKGLSRPPIRLLLIKSIVASLKVLNNQVATYPREFLQTSMITKLFRVGSNLRSHHCRRCDCRGISSSLTAIFPQKRKPSLNLRSSYAKSIQTRMTKYRSWLKP